MNATSNGQILFGEAAARPDAGVNLTDEYTKPVGTRIPAMSKVDKFDWKMTGSRGQFAELPKSVLQVDPEYQRTRVSNGKVLSIASDWRWAAVGCLLVVRRPDGTYWVYDGQHRKLAADKRSDVQFLPCMVYDMAAKKEEANAFLTVNNVRSTVKSIDKFNALLIAQDTAAVAVKQMVESSGYQIVKGDGSNSGKDHTVKCLATLLKAVNQHPNRAHTAWLMAVEVCQGKAVIDDIYSGLFQTECHLARKRCGSLTDDHNRNALLRLSDKQIDMAIAECKKFYGGGAKACAEAIIRLLNKGRRSRRIPSIYGDDNDAD